MSIENQSRIKRNSLTPTSKKSSNIVQTFLSPQHLAPCVHCPECGLLYRKGDAADKRLHDRHHRETLEPPLFLLSNGLHEVELLLDGARIVVMSLTEGERSAIQKLLTPMERELGRISSFSSSSKLYVYVSSTRRALALAIIDLLPSDCQLRPFCGSFSAPNESSSSPAVKRPRVLQSVLTFGKSSSDNAATKQATSASLTCTFPQRQPSLKSSIASSSEESTTNSVRPKAEEAALGVSRVWVHSSARRKGIATTLLHAIRRSAVFGQTFSPSQLAFSEPTPAGATLARAFTRTAQFLTYSDVSTSALLMQEASTAT